MKKNPLPPPLKTPLLYVQFFEVVDGPNDVMKMYKIRCKHFLGLNSQSLLQFFFLIVPSWYSFILNAYLLGEVDAFTPILRIFSFVLHLLFVSLTFPWT